MSKIQEFEEYIESRGLAESTINAYVRAIKDFKMYVHKPLHKATTEDVDTWVRSMQGKGLKHRTINLKINGVKRFYRFLKRRGQSTQEIEGILETELLRIPDIQREVITEDEILVALDNMEDDRNKAILAILFRTGLRAREVINLRKRNFTEKEDYVAINVVNTKGGKNRQVFMDYFYYEFVKEYMYSHHNAGGWVIISSEKWTGYDKADDLSLSYDRFRRLVKSFSKEYLGRELTPHDFRASCFTHLYRQGVDIYTIAKLAGHSSIETTKKYIYADEHDIVGKSIDAFKGGK